MGSYTIRDKIKKNKQVFHMYQCVGGQPVLWQRGQHPSTYKNNLSWSLEAAHDECFSLWWHQ
jgi:hypothetical protein